MSRIFRNVRSQLLKESKTKRYLLYAVGEIFLVVIGILIALYLNNLNSENRAEKENIRLITDLEKGLMNSQFLLDRFTSRVYTQDSLMDLVIRNQLAEADFIRNRTLVELMTPSTQYTWLKDENISTLLQKERDFKPMFNQFFKLIKNYKSRIDDLDNAVEEMNELSNWNDKILAQNFEWFAGSQREDQIKRIQYYLNDPFYKNRLYLYRKKFGNQISQITALIALRAAVLAEINILKGEKKIEWNNFFQSFGLNPLIPVSCESLPQDWERTLSVFNYYLFFNNTPKEIVLMRLRDHNDNWEEYIIGPRAFEILPQFPGRGFMVGFDGKCEKVFIAPRGGYLVLE